MDKDKRKQRIKIILLTLSLFYIQIEIFSLLSWENKKKIITNERDQKL
jgi:hypothetical protein